MPESAAEIGQTIADLIRDHIREHSEYPPNMEGLVETKHDHGLLVWTFEDGSTYRAIVEKVWDSAPPAIDPTPPVIIAPVDMGVIEEIPEEIPQEDDDAAV